MLFYNGKFELMQFTIHCVTSLCWVLFFIRILEDRWLSVGSDLKFDARRDLDDVGAVDVEGKFSAAPGFYRIFVKIGWQGSRMFYEVVSGKGRILPQELGFAFS